MSKKNTPPKGMFTNKDKGTNSIKGLTHKDTGQPLNNIEYHLLADKLFSEMEVKQADSKTGYSYDGYNKDFVQLSKNVRLMKDEGLTDAEINAYISNCIELPNQS